MQYLVLLFRNRSKQISTNVGQRGAETLIFFLSYFQGNLTIEGERARIEFRANNGNIDQYFR